MTVYSKMMDTGPDITSEEREALRAALANLSGELDIIGAYLYGSRARGEAHENSDYDVAIFTGRDPGTESTGRLEMDLCELLEKKSGLRCLDVRILDQAPLMIRGKVLTEGLLLYTGNEVARVRLERETRIRYFEFSSKMKRLDHELLSRISEEGIDHGGS